MIARDDIQGNILRGYARHLHAAYLLTRIDDRERARAFLARLIAEDRIATEGDWGEPPETRLNVAITHPGLQLLRADPAPFAPFTDFREGMRARARAQLGDLGANDPDRWDPVLRQEIHVLFTVYARSADARRDAADALTGELADAGVAVVHRQCADMLKSGREHFGFRDGFSQPALGGRVRGPAIAARRGGPAPPSAPRRRGVARCEARRVRARPRGRGRGGVRCR